MVVYMYALTLSSALCFAGMNPFGNHMGMQSIGQRSTPPLPLNTALNQVITVTRSDTFCRFVIYYCIVVPWEIVHKIFILNAECFDCFREAWALGGCHNRMLHRCKISTCNLDNFKVQVQVLVLDLLTWLTQEMMALK